MEEDCGEGGLWRGKTVEEEDCGGGGSLRDDDDAVGDGHAGHNVDDGGDDVNHFIRNIISKGPENNDDPQNDDD